MTAIEVVGGVPTSAGRGAGAIWGASRAIGLAATFACHVAFWLAVWAFGPTLFGWHAVTLVSGSMAPALGFGDVVVAEPYDGGTLPSGSVVVFQAPGTDRLMTHRVVAALEDGAYRTRGDANVAPDSTPLLPSEIVAVGRLRVPLVGPVVAWWTQGAYLPLMGMLVLLGAVAFLRGAGVPGTEGRATGRVVALRRLAGIAISMVVGIVIVGRMSSAAFGSATANGVNTLAASRIFSSERVTSGFVVRDASGGTVVDRSSPFAAAGDLRTVTTKPWASGFAASRYLQYDMSAPLPAGLGVGSAALRLTFSSEGVSTACVYVEVRRITTDSLLATYGSSSSPAACVTGTTLATLVLPLPVVTSTDLANDLRIRVLGSESGSRGMVVDEARLTGSTPTMGFATFPVRVTDAADGVRLTTPWDLQGP